MFDLMTLFTVSTLISLIFVISNTPMMMALLIVLQTITVAFSIYNLLLTSWLSFILTMIFVSAMMVIFVYVSSLASNDFITFSRSMAAAIASSLPLFMLLAYLTLTKQDDQDKSHLSLSDVDVSPVAFYKLYSAHTNFLTLFLIVYLLVALIVVAKISLYYKGALRALKP